MDITLTFLGSYFHLFCNLNGKHFQGVISSVAQLLHSAHIHSTRFAQLISAHEYVNDFWDTLWFRAKFIMLNEIKDLTEQTGVDVWKHIGNQEYDAWVDAIFVMHNSELKRSETTFQFNVTLCEVLLYLHPCFHSISSGLEASAQKPFESEQKLFSSGSFHPNKDTKDLWNSFVTKDLSSEDSADGNTAMHRYAST